MRWTSGLSFTVLVGTAACLPTYSFDRAPLPEPTQSQQAACYRAKRFQLLRGDAKWRTQHQEGQWMVTQYWSSQGIAFRRGDVRIDAATAIDQLPDKDLVTSYRQLLSETEGSHSRYPTYRFVTFALAFGGLAVTTAALPLALSNPDNDLILPLALGGAGIALLSIIPAVLAGRAYEPAVTHDLDRTLYRRAEWAQRMYGAVEQYNQQVAQECGHAPADVPMTPGASDLIRSSVQSPQAPARPPPPPFTPTPAPGPSGPPGAP